MKIQKPAAWRFQILFMADDQAVAIRFQTDYIIGLGGRYSQTPSLAYGVGEQSLMGSQLFPLNVHDVAGPIQIKRSPFE